MSARVFLDTNVFIYFYSSDNAQKRDAAYLALNNNDCITSIQAMNEACNVWFNKCHWSAEKINAHLDNIELVCDDVLSIKRGTINKALELKDRYGYSYYDSLMLASALEGDCVVILTEDMSDGQVIENKLRIVNPFKQS